jgi:hypothetical protein
MLVLRSGLTLKRAGFHKASPFHILPLFCMWLFLFLPSHTARDPCQDPGTMLFGSLSPQNHELNKCLDFKFPSLRYFVIATQKPRQPLGRFEKRKKI